MNLENRLRDVVSAVLGVPSDRITDSDSPQSIPQWDSVNHLQLMLAVEAEFGTQFTPDEMAALTTIGAIRARVERGVPDA